MKLEQALKEKWYSQGLNTCPLLLVGAAYPKDLMLKHLGFTYKNYLCIFDREDYGDMSYYEPDIKRIGRLLEKRIEKDPRYFIEIKKIYQREISRSNRFYQQIERMNLNKLDLTELVKLLQQVMGCLESSLGVGHLIEPFVITTDFKIKMQLEKYLKNSKELNHVFSLMISPVKEAFINRYEKGLFDIARQKSLKEKEKLAKNLAKEFFWIRNSYAGKKNLTFKEVINESKKSKNRIVQDYRKIIKEKKKIIKEFGLDEKLINKIRASEFLIQWQDERKENILKAIDYVDRVLFKVARKTKCSIRDLHYMIPIEVSLENLMSKEFKQELKQRRKGCIYFYDLKFQKIISGSKYHKFVSKLKEERKIEIKELTGLIANGGTTVGRIKVCLDLKSLNKVRNGDVLVASMTRPEHLLAMKKASAIITDEGGVTCHAAIVSREFQIPCVIGTKIATKVLKDGDLVEVKGNHGLVIVLNKF